MIKTSIFVLLAILSFQLYAENSNDISIISNKNRLDKLERGVSELGLERERARKTNQKIHDDILTRRKNNHLDNKAIRIISNKERLEKLEREVLQLGAERAQIREQIQNRK